jgi:hypothetical protein
MAGFLGSIADQVAKKGGDKPGAAGGTGGTEWIAIQKNTFQNWTNVQLEKGGFQKSEDVTEDFKKGVVLIELVCAPA